MITDKFPIKLTGFQGFFFGSHFGSDKSKKTKFLQFLVGGQGGVQIFFSGLQWFCCDILTHLDPKSYSLALRIVTFSFGHKKVIWLTLPFLRLQNIFWVKTGQNSFLNSLVTRKIILDPPLVPYQFFFKIQFFGLVLPKMWSEKKILQTLWVLYLDWQLGQTH